MATRRRHPASRSPAAKVVYKRRAVSEPEYEEDDELGEGWPVEQLLDKKFVIEEDKETARLRLGFGHHALLRRVGGVWG